MTSTGTYKCKCCGATFSARTADRKRGWARFCSKSCKATKQTSTLGKPRPWQRLDLCLSREDREDLARNPRIIQPLYDEWGDRDGELFFANFSNEEGSDI